MGVHNAGCMEEELCHVSDLRDEDPVYFTCLLYPDTRVCGAYDKPLRQPCSLVLPQDPQTAYQKKGELNTLLPAALSNTTSVSYTTSVLSAE